ncbi:response regulator transcription factor [Novosphingobium tardum]|uniref:Response regulator transcription factor n=1 Tax=Novosphingobium tardum TaxID=1538021 RepID=A0ABV8RNB1_9SPHN
MSRLVIHVLDSDHGRRAGIARQVFALGHHAEVYADPAELAGHAPKDGVVLALEDAAPGGVAGLADLLQRRGHWLAIIATSAAPTIDKAVDAIRQGALDYLALPLATSDLARALTLAEAHVRRDREETTRRVRARSLIESLSRREREVLGLLAEGRSNKEIGRLLGISPRTVEIHRMHALARVGARRSAEGVRLWWEAGEGARKAA